jgi:hypothetical protein
VLIAAIDDIGGVGLVAASPCSVGTSPYAAKRVPLRPNEWLVFIQALGTPLRVNIEPVLLFAPDMCDQRLSTLVFEQI